MINTRSGFPALWRDAVADAMQIHTPALRRVLFILLVSCRNRLPRGLPSLIIFWSRVLLQPFLRFPNYLSSATRVCLGTEPPASSRTPLLPRRGTDAPRVSKSKLRERVSRIEVRSDDTDGSTQRSETTTSASTSTGVYAGSDSDHSRRTHQADRTLSSHRPPRHTCWAARYCT
jgi:hypothetical protein